MEGEQAPVVIDNGSGLLKAGYAGDDAPRVVIPSVVGIPKSENHTDTEVLRKFYTGDEAIQHRGVLSLHHPLQHGSVTDWDSMEKVLHAAFTDLRVDPTEAPVLMSETPLNPTANREQLTQMMFEKFEVPAFFVMTSSVLTVFASGRHMGVILDCGDGVTSVVPIEGLFVRPHANQRVNYAGQELTGHLQRLLMEKGYSVTDTESVRCMKEELCYVAQDYGVEMTLDDVDRNYTLPDGQVVTIGNQRFRTPEALFRPSLIGKEHAGIHKMVYQSIMQCDIDVRSLFYSNIILCGGSTMFPGLGDRLKKEMYTLAPPTMKIGVVEPPERKYTVWIGGSIVASLSTFEKQWISKQEYEEEGPSIVHKKCS
ncbi:actin, cytoplasmic-like [Littorina saxatilis]|uniref:Actin n=1 Tax=Littorina saxatilis TaxID=31220 RepID=A0AAN9G893_9CAEN